MRIKSIACCAILTLAASVALAQTAPPTKSAASKLAVSKQTATAPAAKSAKYSTTTTTIGTLLADPASKAVLQQHVPDLITSDHVDQMVGMTLKDMQQAVGQYAPDLLSDKVLAAIDADLAKLSTKH